MFHQLKNRHVISIMGKDKNNFLQGIITQDINLIKKNHLLYSFILSNKGRILFDIFLFEDDNKIFIETERPEELIKLFSNYKLRSDIEFLLTNTNVYATEHLEENNHGSFCDPRHENMLHRFYTLENKDQRVTEEAYNALRLSLNIPEGSFDFGIDKTWALEWNIADKGISFTKGCYIGQEITSRTKQPGILKKTACVVDMEALSYQEALQNGHVISTYTDKAFIWKI
jgi:folate-binding protein YgfZ